jgi:hypothetical protein
MRCAWLEMYSALRVQQESCLVQGSRGVVLLHCWAVLFTRSLASRGEVRGDVWEYKPAVQQAHAASDRPTS